MLRKVDLAKLPFQVGNERLLGRLSRGRGVLS
jgi:hypothetical protein